MFFTNILDIDREILLRLDDMSLCYICRVNKYSNTLCNEYFWNMRIKHVYNIELTESYYETYRYIYIYLSKAPIEFLLPYAVNRGYLNLVKYILAKYYLSNIKNSVLIIASECGNMEIVKYIVNSVSTDIISDALVTAAKYGQLETLKYLVTKGGDIHARDNIALVLALLNEHIHIIKYLIDAGANITVITKFFIDRLAGHGKLNILQYLVENVANISISNDTLIYAARNGHISVVKYIIENRQTISLDIAIIEAYKNDHMEIIHYLTHQYKT